MKWTDGSIYNGEWLDGKRQGKIVTKWTDGVTYSGEWFGDKCHGIGVWTRANGRVYNVGWKDGKEHTVSYGKLWFRRMSDLTLKGIVARMGHPESVPVDYVLFALMSIVLFYFELSIKNTQDRVDTLSQRMHCLKTQWEFTRRAILIGVPTPQDPFIQLGRNRYFPCGVI